MIGPEYMKFALLILDQDSPAQRTQYVHVLGSLTHRLSSLAERLALDTRGATIAPARSGIGGQVPSQTIPARGCFPGNCWAEPHPIFAEAWYNLSDLLDEQGRSKAAIDCLRRALHAAPDYADAIFNLALLLQRNNKHAGPAEYCAAISPMTPNLNGQYGRVAL
jgi:tetratricopeptide (TPR) repeat protein